MCVCVCVRERDRSQRTLPFLKGPFYCKVLLQVEGRSISRMRRNEVGVGLLVMKICNFRLADKKS